MQIFQALFEEMSDGVVLTHPDVKIQYVNHAFELLSGYKHGELAGASPAMLKSGHHQDDFYLQMWQTLEDKGRWQGEIVNRRKNGEVYSSLLSLTKITNKQGQHVSYLGVFKPITEMHEKGSEAYLQATHHDFLTTLPNRLLFQEKLSVAMALSERHVSRFALLYLSLDDLQATNDIYGYHIGDEVLKVLAERLRKRMRASDSIARLKGNAFGVILTEVKQLEEIGPMIRNFLNWLSLPISINEHTLAISASIGVAVYPDDSVDADTLLRQAGTAMRQARQAGKGHFCFYTP